MLASQEANSAIELLEDPGAALLRFDGRERGVFNIQSPGAGAYGPLVGVHQDRGLAQLGVTIADEVTGFPERFLA
ncbi:hypothetical protein D3C72_2132780 [compost metagenome]